MEAVAERNFARSDQLHETITAAFAVIKYCLGSRRSTQEWFWEILSITNGRCLHWMLDSAVFHVDGFISD